MRTHWQLMPYANILRKLRPILFMALIVGELHWYVREGRDPNYLTFIGSSMDTFHLQFSSKYRPADTYKTISGLIPSPGEKKVR